MWSFPVHPPCWLQLFGVAHEDQTRFYPKWIQMARKGRKHKWWVWEFWNLKSWEIQSDNFSHEKFWNLENYKWKYKAHEFSVLRNSFSVLRNIFFGWFLFFFQKNPMNKLVLPQTVHTTALPNHKLASQAWIFQAPFQNESGHLSDLPGGEVWVFFLE